jgi:hypothetical protein
MKYFVVVSLLGWLSLLSWGNLCIYAADNNILEATDNRLQGTDATRETTDHRPSTTYKDIARVCPETFAATGECPSEICHVSCVDQVKDGSCAELLCRPLPCEEITAESCPLDVCQILQGCDNQPVCYSQPEFIAATCGDLAYTGQEVACCEGLMRRCGMEFIDGTCDMSGRHSVYSVGICVPCGNGVCNQFENKCNCPEDCK